MIKVGIVGVSGYGGGELFRILYNHPEVTIKAISSRTYANKQIGEVYPHLRNHDFVCKKYSVEEIVDSCDVLFTSVPHGGPAMEYVICVKENSKKMIDLSADFRFANLATYEKWYTKHTQPNILKEAVYGLPELYKKEIQDAWLIGNPGCYTTAGILSNVPLLQNRLIDSKSIIIDSKSGASGAGRKAKQMLHFPELDSGIQAYSIAGHRHTPEIEEQLSFIAEEDIVLTFTPHLVPMIRGILSVSYAKLTKNIKADDISALFKEYYKDQPFVRILEDQLPNTKFVYGSNYIDICVRVDERTNTVIILSAIDNLVKGASGQAVQNMNIMFGLEETMGLDNIPIYP